MVPKPNIPRKMETRLHRDRRKPKHLLLESSGVERKPHVKHDWDSKFLLLLQFRDREGHVRVPVNHVEDGNKLGCWIQRLRLKKRNGATLCPEKERRFKEIGFTWNAHEGKWDTMLRALAQFHQREGHAEVPCKHIEYLDGDGKLNLGTWLKLQRSLQRCGMLDARRAELLLAHMVPKPNIPLQIETGRHRDRRKHLLQSYGVGLKPHVIEWDFKFLLLLEFRDREGHMRVPVNHFRDGKNLGAWAIHQRNQKKDGKICPEKERRLNEVGFIWNAREGKWDTMMRALAQFNQREGHVNVPRNHIEDLDDGGKLNLGLWLKCQLSLQGRGTLDVKKWELLESLGVDRHCQAINAQERFDRYFDLLLVFREREGHVRVPTTHKEGATNLGNWMAGQRYAYRRGNLDLDRQKWLEVAGVTWKRRRRLNVDHDPGLLL
jgi:hypothetical protein